MFPAVPEAVIPLVEPTPMAAPEDSVKLPDPEIVVVSMLNVEPLLTLKLTVLLMAPVLVKVCVPALLKLNFP